MVEAEEAMELKRALSSQMLHLLLEQERRLEGHLRDCITFAGGSGGDGLSPDRLKHFSRAGSRRWENDRPNGRPLGAQAETGDDDEPGSVHDGISASADADADAEAEAGDGSSSVPGAIVMDRDAPGGSERWAAPRRQRVLRGDESGSGEHEDDEGFEKVEGWMAEGLEAEGRRSAAGCDGEQGPGRKGPGAGGDLRGSSGGIRP